jgi:sodium-dependent dicarboxylate transporter 2/3/5
VLFVCLAIYLGAVCRAGVREIPGFGDRLRSQQEKLGPWTRSQTSTLIAWSVTVSLWLTPAVLSVVDWTGGGLAGAFQQCCPEPIAALLGATLLFLLPGDKSERAMTWDEASRIDWGVLLLFGGGLSLGVLSFQTGLAEALGKGLAAVIPTQTSLGMLIVATVSAALVSEVTSNTASANMMVPVAIVTAQAAGIDPLEPALGATFGSGLGFMLPVSTPCNAIVFSSGYIPLRRMMSYGLLLDVVGVVVIVGIIRTIVPWVR